VPYVVPVKDLTGEKGENGPNTLDQDRDGCVEALNRLVTDITEYERISDSSREVTSVWINEIRTDAQEQWLLGMRPKRQVRQVRDPTILPSTKFSFTKKMVEMAI
jgi:hypothetical protein